ncbi:MAG: methionine--tRNA ligase [Planctomycetota bacterium]
MNPYYITTPIYYVNDRPHIGHCYTSLLADVAARFQRLSRGQEMGSAKGAPGEVFLLTGTDEHADKVVTSASAHGKSAQEWADINAEQFKAAFAWMNISNDDFIRTTEPRHRERVPVYIQKLMDSGDIYKGEYTGWYDEGQEEYVPENSAREAGYKSAISGRPLVKRTEPCYFFKLSKYGKPLADHLAANPTFVQPDSRRSEILGRIRQGLNDIPISRPVTDDPATQWGIRVPGDATNRIYVWIDALFNYLTVVDTPQRRPLWPAAVHLIGKDILWFHAAIWPALLMALRAADAKEFGWVTPPSMIFGHGWWISNGQKMSKSLGNFIDLEKLQAYADRYSIDAVRWYLAKDGPMSGADADFSYTKFVEVYNADLANGIGNCASWVANMVEKYFGTLPTPEAGGSLPAGSVAAPPQHARFNFPALCSGAVARAGAKAAALDLAGVLAEGIELIRNVDVYINETAPFKLAKTIDTDPTAKARLATILYNCAEAVRVASVLMSSAMPTKMGQLWQAWNCVPKAGEPLATLCAFGGASGLRPGSMIAKGEALFMRADAALPEPA